jgi:hypothetical protein
MVNLENKHASLNMSCTLTLTGRIEGSEVFAIYLKLPLSVVYCKSSLKFRELASSSRVYGIFNLVHESASRLENWIVLGCELLATSELPLRNSASTSLILKPAVPDRMLSSPNEMLFHPVRTSISKNLDSARRI